MKLRKGDGKFLVLLSLLMIAKALLLAFFLPVVGIGLAPDEAQYWTWSQQLDWGYYSKPPAVAWQIWLGTQLFDNSEVGVRAATAVVGFFLPMAVYVLAAACRVAPAVAFLSATAMAFSPMGVVSSFLATTDGGFLLFWTLACVEAAFAFSENSPLRYGKIGFYLLCGMLFKWPTILFWPFLFFLLLLLKKPIAYGQLCKGIALSFVGLLPCVIWNSSHEWATFRHVEATVVGAETSSSLFQGNFAEFIGAQFFLFSPFFFLFFCFGLWKFFVNKVPLGLAFCALLSLSIFCCYSFASLFRKMQANWCLYAYPTAFVFASWSMEFFCRQGRKALAAAVVFSLFLAAFVLSIPYVQAHSLVAKWPLPYRINPFRHELGWEKLSLLLAEVGYDPKRHFLFADTYQTTSLLSFYSPEQKQAYFFNLHGRRKNQFSYWPQMNREVGNKGFFVWIENKHSGDDLAPLFNSLQQKLKPYFSSIQLRAVAPLFYAYGRAEKIAVVFSCEGYNGSEPPEVFLY